MSKLKKMLIDELIEQAGENARAQASLEKARGQIQTLLVAEAHVQTRDAIIEQQKAKISELIHHNELTQCELNAHERALKSLHDAGFAALKKLKINSPERVALSHAIQAADSIMIPF